MRCVCVDTYICVSMDNVRLLFAPLREDAHAVATLGNVRLVVDPLCEDAQAVATLGRAKTLLLSPTRFDHKGSSYRCAVQPLALGEA